MGTGCEETASYYHGQVWYFLSVIYSLDCFMDLCWFSTKCLSPVLLFVSSCMYLLASFTYISCIVVYITDMLFLSGLMKLLHCISCACCVCWLFIFYICMYNQVLRIGFRLTSFDSWKYCTLLHVYALCKCSICYIT